MKRLIVLAIVVCLFRLSSPAASLKWETDFEKAAEAAKSSNRYMLLDFSGSDWCGWCMKLDEEVFSKKGFREYAEENLVCVLLDFPRGKELKKSLKEQNQRLSAKYGVRGFPTVLVLSPTGETVGKTGYQDGGAEKYVEHLKSFIDPHRKKNNVPEPASASQTGRTSPSAGAMHGPIRKTLPKDENREMRAWTSRSGASVTASLVEEKGPYVVLKKEDGTQLQILGEQLSVQDRQYVSGLKAQPQGPSTNTPAGP